MSGSKLPVLQVDYTQDELSTLLNDTHVLAVFGFAPQARFTRDPRYLAVHLEAIPSNPPFEVWRSQNPVQYGTHRDLRWSTDGDYSFGAIEINESDYVDFVEASEAAYRQLITFVSNSPTPHLLRIWNYMDAINTGAGDNERYRQFCIGRTRALGDHFAGAYPAATAIGCRNGTRTLQIYWLAARLAGKPIENLRQTSAWLYPRCYGPTPPTFARATLSSAAQLFISGTAAVIGHKSYHPQDVQAQIEETLNNLDSLLANITPTMPPYGACSVLKAYLRNPNDAASVQRVLKERLPELTHLLLLTGDICRTELLVEIDGLHTSPASNTYS